MLSKILKDIEDNKDEIVDGLLEMISLCSADGKSTDAQVLVEKQLKDLGFEVTSFKGIDPRSVDLPDYCQPDIEYDENAYNVVGVKKGSGEVDSLMLFGHIDTEAEDYFGRFDNPYLAYQDGDKIYGLGSSDDKGGIAMMLYAAKYVCKNVKKLPYDLTVMSILGKHGGAYGTLSALMRGYTGVNSIYLHPAETGHGFGEIKNISLGVIDLSINVKGKLGEMHDDLATGINSNVIASKIICALEKLNQENRRKYLFDFGSFKGLPSYVLNVGSINSNYGNGGIALNTNIKLRIRFYKPLTIDDVVNEVDRVLVKLCNEENIDPSYVELQKGVFRASPAIIENEHPFVKLIENNISSVTGINEFIHQYHGGSDIRLPILYGNSNCVGIGPSCILPEKDSNEMEWISKEDYINGVKILASILYNYCEFE